MQMQMNLSFEVEYLTRQEMMESFYRLSFDECVQLTPPEKIKKVTQTFKEFCASRGVHDPEHLLLQGLNGVIGGFMAKQMSGSRSAYRDVAPGKHAQAQLDALLKEYQGTFDAGVNTAWEECPVDVQRDTVAFHARVRTIIRRSVRWAKKNGQAKHVLPEHAKYL